MSLIFIITIITTVSKYSTCWEFTLVQIQSKYLLTKNESLAVDSISNSHRKEINLFQVTS